MFCFTPKGRLIALPRGATPIDFAYAVHTDVGNTAVGARSTAASCRCSPNCTTATRSRSRAPRAGAAGGLGSHRRDGQGARRHPPGDARCRAQAICRPWTPDRRARFRARQARRYSEEKLKGALPRLARSSIEDVLAAVGRGEIFSGDVVRAVYPDFKEERIAGRRARSRAEGGWFGMKKAEGLVFKIPGLGAKGRGQKSIPIRGSTAIFRCVSLPNGGAVPGDRIVGILTPGEGITIYPIQSPALTAFDDQPDRWLDVRWDIDETSRSASRRRSP